MRYLFGDSTPFPLEQNFLETLRGVVEASSSLLRVDEVLEEEQVRFQTARQEAEQEGGRLDRLGMRVAQLFQAEIEGSDAAQAAPQVASQVLEAARGVIHQAKRQITERRDGLLRDVETASAERKAGIARALEQFFAAHDLPGTTWRLRWKASDEVAEMAALISTSFGLDALLSVSIAASSRFAAPVRMSEVEKGFQLRMPRKGLFRKSLDLKPRNLESYLITEIVTSPEKAAFTLRRPGKGPQPGVEVIVRDEGQSSPVARVLGDDVGEGQVIVLDVVETSVVERVWRELETDLRVLASARRRLKDAVFEGKPVRELERPIGLAARMLDTVAPLVREMRRRGASSSELVLKRDLGGGRREELFVDRGELIALFSDLSAPRRVLFDELALERDRSTLGEPPGEATGEVTVTGEIVSADTDVSTAPNQVQRNVQGRVRAMAAGSAPAPAPTPAPSRPQKLAGSLTAALKAISA